MSIEVKVPVLPESVADATVDTWHKKPGDAVRRDENIVDLETDKVVLEVPAPRDGTLKEILKQSGDTVTSEEVIAVIEEGAVEQPEKSATKTSETGQPEAAQAPPGDASEKKAKKEKKKQKDKPAAGKRADEKAPAPQSDRTAPPPDTAPGDGEEPHLSPAVRRLVEENNLDPRRIPATGRGGRLTKADVLNYLEQTPEEPASPEAASARPGAPADRAEERVSMSRLRARIAERMVEAQQTAAILTSFNEVDLQAVKTLRTRYRDEFEKQHGVRLGFMSFFVKASVEALKRFPVVNASIDGTDIVYHGYYDIGIAVSTKRGLVVPIIRDADQKSFARIEHEIAEYAKRARDGRLTIDELTGGTFSITNGGVFGSLVSTPILNPPQSAILGMHAIKDRPVVVDGEIAVRPMMYLALSYDHRLIDGKDAVQFLVALKEVLEDPARLLLEV